MGTGFIGAYYAAAGGPIPKEYLFILEFDDEGFLKGFEKTGSIWKSTQARIEKWARPGADKPPVQGRDIFIIDPVPQAYITVDRASHPLIPVRFRMGEFRHIGTDSPSDTLIGHKKAAFGIITADVHACRSVTDIVRTAITAQLEAAGHKRDDRDADIIVEGDLTEFAAATSISLWSWDAIGSIDITVRIFASSTSHGIFIRHYKTKQVTKTFLGPSREDFERVIRRCLEDIQKQIALDVELAEILYGKRRNSLFDRPPSPPFIKYHVAALCHTGVCLFKCNKRSVNRTKKSKLGADINRLARRVLLRRRWKTADDFQSTFFAFVCVTPVHPFALHFLFDLMSQKYHVMQSSANLDDIVDKLRYFDPAGLTRWSCSSGLGLESFYVQSQCVPHRVVAVFESACKVPGKNSPAQWWQWYRRSIGYEEKHLSGMAAGRIHQRCSLIAQCPILS